MSLQGEWKRFFQILVILAFTGCASENYLFLPASVVDHTERGKAYYPIPPKAPTGTVRTMSGGVVQLKPNEDGTKFPALYVRMVLSNQSSKIPWTVNPQKQTVAFPNGGSPISPVFVQSGSMSSSSTLVVNQGEMKVLDLYFSLPKGENSAEDIPEFDFRWQVQVDSNVIQETTVFDRVELPTYSNYYTPYSSYYFSPFGPYYPYSPYYPFGSYYPFGLSYGWVTPWVWEVPQIAVPPPSKPVIIGH